MLSGVAKKARKHPGTLIKFHANPGHGWNPASSAVCAHEVVQLHRRAIADGDDELVNVF